MTCSSSLEKPVQTFDYFERSKPLPRSPKKRGSARTLRHGISQPNLQTSTSDHISHRGKSDAYTQCLENLVNDRENICPWSRKSNRILEN